MRATNNFYSPQCNLLLSKMKSNNVLILIFLFSNFVGLYIGSAYIPLIQEEYQDISPVTGQPVEITRGHEHIGRVSAAGELPAARAMAVLEYPHVVLEFVADLSAQATARYNVV